MVTAVSHASTATSMTELNSNQVRFPSRKHLLTLLEELCMSYAAPLEEDPWTLNWFPPIASEAIPPFPSADLALQSFNNVH